jgi:hypothetical protein
MGNIGSEPGSGAKLIEWPYCKRRAADESVERGDLS